MTEEIDRFCHVTWGLGKHEADYTVPPQSAYSGNTQSNCDNRPDRYDRYESPHHKDNSWSNAEDADTSNACGIRSTDRPITIYSPRTICDELYTPWTRRGLQAIIDRYHDKPWNFFQAACTAEQEPDLTLLKENELRPLFMAYELYQFKGYREFLSRLPYCHYFIDKLQFALINSAPFVAMTKKLPGYKEHSFACAVQQLRDTLVHNENERRAAMRTTFTD